MAAFPSGYVKPSRTAYTPNRTPIASPVDALLARRRGRSLTDGQRRMIREVCEGRGGVLVIEGRAGTGKTAAAEVVRRAFERAGLTIVGAALPGRAGVQLAQDSGIRSETVATTLQCLERGLALPRGSALLVDEAGMVGSADTATLVRYADEQGWKLVLIGDRAQLQPIDGGAAFRALGDRLGTVELDEVLRQKEPWQREAAAAIRTNRGAPRRASSGSTEVRPRSRTAIACGWSRSTGSACSWSARLIRAVSGSTATAIRTSIGDTPSRPTEVRG